MKPLYKYLAQLIIPFVALTSAYSGSRKELGIEVPDKASSTSSYCPFAPDCIMIFYDTDPEPDGKTDMAESYEIIGYEDGIPVLAMDPFAIWKDRNNDNTNKNPDGSFQNNEQYRKTGEEWISVEDILEKERESRKRRHESNKRRKGI